MNYYSPREIRDAEGKPTGKFHYTVKNDGHISAVGYCSPWVTCPACNGDSCPYTSRVQHKQDCETCKNRGLVISPTACPGHDTEEGACEHQKEYYLDTANYNVTMTTQQVKCEVCGEWTSRYVTYGEGKLAGCVLCDKHANRDELAKLIKVGTCVSSC